MIGKLLLIFLNSSTCCFCTRQACYACDGCESLSVKFPKSVFLCKQFVLAKKTDFLYNKIRIKKSIFVIQKSERASACLCDGGCGYRI